MTWYVLHCQSWAWLCVLGACVSIWAGYNLGPALRSGPVPQILVSLVPEALIIAATLIGIRDTRSGLRKAVTQINSEIYSKTKYREQVEAASRWYSEHARDIYAAVRFGQAPSWKVWQGAPPWKDMSYTQSRAVFRIFNRAEFVRYDKAAKDFIWKVAFLEELAVHWAQRLQQHSPEVRARAFVKRFSESDPAFATLLESLAQAAELGAPTLELKKRQAEEASERELTRRQEERRQLLLRAEQERTEREAEAARATAIRLEQEMLVFAVKRKHMGDQASVEYDRLCKAIARVKGVGGTEQVAELECRQKEVLAILHELRGSNI
jgi:hypothetical protein